MTDPYVIRAVGEGDVKSVLKQADAMVNGGLSVDSLIAALVDHLRNLLVLRTCGPDEELVVGPTVSTVGSVWVCVRPAPFFFLTSRAAFVLWAVVRSLVLIPGLATGWAVALFALAWALLAGWGAWCLVVR